MKGHILKRGLLIAGLIGLLYPAQAAFQEGYVINLKGDTIKGLLAERSLSSLSKQCQFKSLSTGKVTKYGVDDLRGFEFTSTGRRFFTGTIPYFGGERTLFLEVLQAGRLNLYYAHNVVLNDVFYVSKRDPKLLDITYDWDKKWLPKKADYKDYLKRAMLDAPDLMDDIERLDNPSVFNVADLVMTYNRKFDKQRTPYVNTTIKPETNLGLTFSTGIAIPSCVEMDIRYVDVYNGLSVSYNPSKKDRGLYLTTGLYKPFFSATTKNKVFKTLPPMYTQDYTFLLMSPFRASYRFTNNIIQPEVGLELEAFFNNDDTRFFLGPSVGLNVNVTKWLSLSCTLEYVFAEFYAKSIRYQSASPYTLFTSLHVNL